MADGEGQVTVADTQVKSLVSDQYLDGWSYEDDEDDEEADSSTSQSHGHQTEVKPMTSGTTGVQVKRQHCDSDVTEAEREAERRDVSSSEPIEKKFCMSFSSKGGGGRSTSANMDGPLTSSTKSKSSISTGFTPLTAHKNVDTALAKTKSKAAPIKMNLSSQSKPKEVSLTPSLKKSSAVAQAFAGDSDESEEEMPPEARMRMRNIGRETPTAAGPNSFGKGRLGFCDRQKIIQRELQTDAKSSNSK